LNDRVTREVQQVPVRDIEQASIAERDQVSVQDLDEAPPVDLDLPSAPTVPKTAPSLAGKVTPPGTITLKSKGKVL
jgi:hypothetical protein